MERGCLFLRDGGPQVSLAGLVRNVVEVAVWVGELVVDSGWRDLVAQRHDANGRFESTRRGSEVAGHGLCRGDSQGVGMLGEDLLNRGSFGLVVELGCRAVGVDVIDVFRTKGSIGKSALDRQG